MTEYVFIWDSGEVEVIGRQEAAPARAPIPAVSTQDAGRFGLLEDVGQTPAVTLFRITLRDAVVSFLPGLEGVVRDRHGRLVRETTYFTKDAQHAAVSGETAGPVNEMDGAAVLTTDAMWKNYFHWLCIALGKARLASPSLPPDAVRIIPDYVPHGYAGKGGSYSEILREQSLTRLLPHTPVLSLAPGLYRFPELHLIWTDSGQGAFHTILNTFYPPFHELRRRAEPGRLRRLLIVRGERPRMTPEEVGLLSDVAREHGYEEVRLEDLTFDQEVELFSQAERVVGMHGSGLTNVLFCPPEAKVLELTKNLDGETYLRPWIHLLANGSGQAHNFLDMTEGGLRRQDLEEAFATLG